MEDRVYPSSYNNGGPQNNGYKGFSYNYPLQQPESPQPPRNKRRRCCKCCCWGLLILVLLLCIGAALVYFLMKPKVPKYTIEDGTITQFNMTADNRLNTDIRFVITARNPNKDVEFFFSNVSVEASYEGANIGQGSIGAFQQKHESTIQLPFQVRGRDIAIRGSPATSLKKGLATKGSTLDIKLKAKTNLKVKIGSLKSWGQKVKLSCHVFMNVPSKPGKAEIVSSSCKLKN